MQQLTFGGRLGFWLTVVLVMVVTSLAQSESRLRLRRSEVTGLVRSLETVDRGPIQVSTRQGLDRVQAIDVFDDYGQLFGILDPPKQLKFQAVRHDHIGQGHTKFQQLHNGVPVFSAVLAVHQDADGNVLAVNGETFPIPQSLGTSPSLLPVEAAEIAITHVVALQASVISNDLVVVDPGWYGDAPQGPHLAYHVVVASVLSAVMEALFVDAHSGAILDQWSLAYLDRDRRVYDGGGATDIPGSLVRSEGDPAAEPSGDQVVDDINSAYDYMGDVYAFFRNAYGRDSIDDLGLPLISTVNSTALGSGCPSAFFTANWRQVVFCLGRVPDDVVGHEFTHGLTFFSAGLIYQNQSGSLNEHFSFVFGETVDLYNSGSETVGQTLGPPFWSDHPSGTGIDEPNIRRTTCSSAPDYTAGVRWLYNEDRIQNEGAIYDYWDPTCLNHPDRADSFLATCPVFNRGGTHLSAEIPNHAYALLTDGGSFNGIDVVGIGLMKSAAIWYRALTTYLTPGADFEDAYWALNRAAADLVGSFPNDPRTGQPSLDMFTDDDAVQLDAALRAVEMNSIGRCGQGSDVLSSMPPTVCESRDIFLDEDFETGLPVAWTTSNTSPPTAYDWDVTNAETVLPFDRQGRVAYCPDLDRSCFEGDESALHSLLSPVVQLSDNLTLPILELTHFMASEAGWDGGVLSLRVNGGLWQPVPAEAIFYNGYNQLLLDEASGNVNPLAGQAAFSGSGGNWGTTLVSLVGLAAGGDAVEVRFDYGKDFCFGHRGWYVDDVQIYDCSSALDCDSNGVPDAAQMAHAGQAEVIVRHPSGHGERSFSDADPLGVTVKVEAQRFDLLVAKTVRLVRIWGGHFPFNSMPGESFTVIFHHSNTSDGLPGETISSENVRASTIVDTGFDIGGMQEWEISLELAEPVSLLPGTYWVEVFADSAGEADTFVWINAEFSRTSIHTASASEAPGVIWVANGTFHHAIEIEADSIGDDCNFNGILDACDIAAATSRDLDGNRIPDECEVPGPRRPGDERFRPGL